jgi:hypothetical protein
LPKLLISIKAIGAVATQLITTDVGPLKKLIPLSDYKPPTNLRCKNNIFVPIELFVKFKCT